MYIGFEEKSMSSEAFRIAIQYDLTKHEIDKHMLSKIDLQNPQLCF